MGIGTPDSRALSVVVSAFDVRETVSRCLESILSQIGPETEVVCVDNRSTDGTGELLDGFAARDSRVRVIHNERNIGLLESRHVGAAAAVGEYLLFVDADDELLPGGVSTALRTIRERGTDLVVFGVDFNVVGDVDLPGFEAYFRQKGEVNAAMRYPVLEACYLRRAFTWNSWNKIYRTEVVKRAVRELKGDDIVQGEDVYLSFLIGAFARSAAMTREKVYRYRIGDGLSTNRTFTAGNFERYLAYVVGARRVLDFAATQPSDPVLQAAAREVAFNARRVLANVLEHRLAPDCREAGRVRLREQAAAFGLERVFMQEIDQEELLRYEARRLFAEQAAEYEREWKRRFEGMQAELDDIRHSVSYRIGLVFTFPFRKLRRLIWGN